MKKQDYIHIKYVELLAYWKILYQIHRTPGDNINGILSTVASDYALGGRLPVKRGFQICINQRAIDFGENSTVILSSSGSRVLEIELKNEPSELALREIVRTLLIEHKFPWVVFCSNDATAFRTAVPDNWVQILDNCGLFELENPLILKWWESLFYKYSRDKEERAKKIGDIAEILTYNLEIDRITKDGFDPSIKVNHAASIDDSLGFDIISLHGTLHDGKNDEAIFVEVKSSEFIDHNRFKFYISRNEWNTALENLSKYFFYCWTGVKMNGTYKSGPYTFTASQIKSLVPEDKSAHGEWTKCRLTLDLNNFKKILIKP